MSSGRETFGTKFGTVLTTIGVAVGLGNVWRFPYMAGRYGGAAFVAVYVLAVALIGVPALMAELALGRSTRRGTVGAFERSGLPAGRIAGWFFFAVVTAAMGYYTDVIGWVLYHALAQALSIAGVSLDAGAILPPAEGISPASLLRQVACTGVVIGACAWVLSAGVRKGIERASRWLTPAIFAVLLVLIARSLTLPGARAGLEWYVLKFDPANLSSGVAVAALGQAIFSLSLGGTFMVVCGSYLSEETSLARTAIWTAAGDTAAGLLAGLAIFPAVFALKIEPASGPGLVFSTLPAAFAKMPGGALFGLLFFAGLAGAAFLSDVAAFEVLVAGLADNTRLNRKRAIAVMSVAVFALAIPPMLNMRIFLPWDLTLGSGMQTLGALLAVVTVGWCLDRSALLEQLGGSGGRAYPFLVTWLRWVVPAAVISVGVWWVLHDLFGLATGG